MNVLLANPRGFCAGVERAVDIVEKTLQQYGKPIYVRHEIVHNKQVVEDLKKKGAIFVEELEEIPSGQRVIFSAHGVAKSVCEEAEKRKLFFIDATCPLVKKVHRSVHRYANKDRKILLIGHQGHPEVIGTMGQLKDHQVILIESIEDVEKLDFSPNEKLAYTTQTTLSVYETKNIIEALKKKYPEIQGPPQGDMCYATTNRQEAILELAQKSDVVFVVGSKNSSNSNRLVEMARNHCPDAYLVHNIDELHPNLLRGKKNIGISSGASAPESSVQELIAWLKKNGEVTQIKDLIVSVEKVKFPLPKELVE